VCVSQLHAEKASLNEHLQPLLEHSAALGSAGSKSASKGDEAKESAAAARRRVLHTLGRAGQLLWPHLTPGTALEASQQLVEHVATVVLSDVLRKKVRHISLTGPICTGASWHRSRAWHCAVVMGVPLFVRLLFQQCGPTWDKADLVFAGVVFVAPSGHW
jgi:hypothetical protein